MTAATVIVPTHRGAARIGALLDSLEAQSRPAQVIVVDNASSDGTAELLGARAGVEVLRNERNVGFGAAVNMAARRAEGEALVMVNDDCVLDPGFVEAISRPLDRAGGVVMTAGVMRDPNREALIDSAGMELDPTLLVFDYLHGEPLEVLDEDPSDPIGPSAAAAGFDRDAFLEVGGFDEAFFAYWEDVDLVLRMRLAGGRCVLAADARGSHMHSATLGSGSAAKNELMGFGRGYVLRKWGVMRGRRLARVLLSDSVICAGQAAIDHNLSGFRGRARGYRATQQEFEYPRGVLAEATRRGLIQDLARRLTRRRRIRALTSESPREGLERELSVGVGGRSAPEEPLSAGLTVPVPDPVAVGDGTAIFLGGPIGGGSPAPHVELSVDGVRAERPVRVVNPDGAEPSFWWTTLPQPAITDPRELALELRPGGERGGSGASDLGSIELIPAVEGARLPAGELEAAIEAAQGDPLVAICMATYEPDPALFSVQVDSIKAQTHRGWICLISDDGTSPDGLEQMRAAIGRDPRFVLLAGQRRLGFYGNYERALATVPDEAELVALADQDDRWFDEKLEVLIAGLGDRDLVYGDMRIVARDGAVIADTYWTLRRNNHTDLASLVVGNTVTGAASMFRADLLERALPFPPPRGTSYHDHWIALSALTRRGLAYVDRPLQDYVQHGGAAQGHAEANQGGRYLQLRLLAYFVWQGIRVLFGGRGARGWASRYFGMHTRTMLWAEILLARTGESLPRRKRRMLERFARAERSPLALIWLAGRSLRPLWGANEAFGRELIILSSALWGRALQARSRLRDRLSGG